MKIEKGKTYKALFDNSVCDKDTIVTVRDYKFAVGGYEVTCQIANTNIMAEGIPASGFVNIFERI